MLALEKFGGSEHWTGITINYTAYSKSAWQSDSPVDIFISKEQLKEIANESEEK